MISRRRRTEALIESDPSLAGELAALIEAITEPVEVVPPRQGLVMNQVRETARNSRFYLGEALMSECRVRIGDTEGLGVALGTNGNLARALAIIDAAYALPEPLPVMEEIERRIAAAEQEVERRRERDATETMASRVSFDTMGGQDMSVQAVVK